MQSSVELPIEYLHLSKHFDYDFIIASTCLDQPEYLTYYIQSRQDNPNRFTILDNGAFETGESMEDIAYLELARNLKPDVLVIPDVAFEYSLTVGRFLEFMKLWGNNPVPNCELMGVIQAEGDAETAQHMGELYLDGGVKWIGVPYISRLDRYSFIKSHPEYKNVHILGLPTLPEALSLQTLSNVKSCDSSLPVKCSIQDKRIEVELSAPSHLGIGISPYMRDIDEKLLINNIGIFKATCNGTVRITRL